MTQIGQAALCPKNEPIWEAKLLYENPLKFKNGRSYRHSRDFRQAEAPGASRSLCGDDEGEGIGGNGSATRSSQSGPGNQRSKWYAFGLAV